MATGTVSNTGGNWNGTSSWVSGVVPAVSDSVTFVATSGPLVVNVSSSCASINFSNYRNTITFNNTLSVSGNVTLATGFTQSGTYSLIVNATASMTSNGSYWNTPFTVSGNNTFTFVDTWTFSTFYIAASSNTTLSGNGFTTGTFSILSSASQSHTFAAGKTYSFTSNFSNMNMPGTIGFNFNTLYTTVKSSSSGTQSNFVLSYGASCNAMNMSFVDINASNGRKMVIWSPNFSFYDARSFQNTKNIVCYSDLITVGN